MGWLAVNIGLAAIVFASVVAVALWLVLSDRGPQRAAVAVRAPRAEAGTGPVAPEAYDRAA